MSAPRTNERRLLRTLRARLFYGLCVGATLLACAMLVLLVVTLVRQGAPRLFTFDAERAAELRQPVEPNEFSDLAKVPWADLARVTGHDVLTALDRVPWAELGDRQGLEWADQLAQIDWAEAAEHAPLPLTELAGLDWEAVYAQARIPGEGEWSARFLATGAGQFLTSPPSRHADESGIGPALAGTLWICVLCALLALPIGVATAILLEEYKPKGPLARRIHALVQLNIANLSGVPSIVYGILGLTAFVGMFGLFGSPLEPTLELGDPQSWLYLRLPLGRSVLAGGMTLMLVVLPVVILSSQEALRAVPDSLRLGALALGATRWQMISRTTLPAAIPGIMTGAILAMSRAIGEAAPVLVICGIVFIRFTPPNWMGDFTALPLQIYNWAGRPQADFHRAAAAGILVLLSVLFLFNALAIVIRQKFQRPMQ